MVSRTQVKVSQCGSCGESHVVELTELASPKPPWTHWYVCPNTNDPVMASILVRDDRHIEANAKVCNALIEAEVEGNLLAAIFYRRGKHLHLHRICSTFDRDSFKDVIRDLSKDLESEHGPPPKQEMEEAKQLPAQVQLFGEEK